MIASLFAATPKLATPPVDWTALAPPLILIGGAILLLVLAALLPKRTKFGWHAAFTIVTALFAMAWVVPLWRDVQLHGPYSVVAGAVGVDGFSLFLTEVICVSVILAALMH